jgi:hypothetical protein
MLAVIGYIVPEVYRWPGEIAPGIKFADIPNGVAALDKVPALGWMQIFFLIGAVDYSGFLGDFEMGKAPNMDAATLETRRMNEISNGRLAMLAFLELVRHDSQNYMSPGFDGYEHLIVSSRVSSRLIPISFPLISPYSLLSSHFLARLASRSSTENKRIGFTMQNRPFSQ